MMQLGCRQARYCGRDKTEFQWFMGATVANLTLAIGEQKGPKAANRLNIALQRFLTGLVEVARDSLRRIVATSCQWRSLAWAFEV